MFTGDELRGKSPRMKISHMAKKYSHEVSTDFGGAQSQGVSNAIFIEGYAGFHTAGASAGAINDVPLRGHLVATCLGDENSAPAAVTVCDLLCMGIVVYMCPPSVLDDSAKQAVNTLRRQHGEKTRERWSRMLLKIPV